MRPDKNAVVTGEVLYRMTYTRTVVREILRFRPPAPMVPQVNAQGHSVVPASLFALTEQARPAAAMLKRPCCCYASPGTGRRHAGACLLLCSCLLAPASAASPARLPRCIGIADCAERLPFCPSTISCCALQIAQNDFRLSEEYVARKGTLIMPSITAAAMQVCWLQNLASRCSSQRGCLVDSVLGSM